jgi:hypothetical protein
MGRLEPFAVRRRERRGIRQFVLQRPDEQRQRRPKFVADVAEEGGLRAVDVGERLRPLPFRFVRAGVCDRDPHLIGDQAEETLIALVERPARIEADDEASRPSAAGQRQRRRLDQIGLSLREASFGIWRRRLQLVLEIFTRRIRDEVDARGAPIRFVA